MHNKKEKYVSCINLQDYFGVPEEYFAQVKTMVYVKHTCNRHTVWLWVNGFCEAAVGFIYL
jgi:hypothetical protein